MALVVDRAATMLPKQRLNSSHSVQAATAHTVWRIGRIALPVHDYAFIARFINV
jgi:hypothetical protein